MAQDTTAGQWVQLGGGGGPEAYVARPQVREARGAVILAVRCSA